MHPRRPAFRQRRRQFVRALQIIRLEGLVTGEYQPLSDRERMYLELLRRNRSPDIEDFILTEPLLLLERMTGLDDDPQDPGALQAAAP